VRADKHTTAMQPRTCQVACVGACGERRHAAVPRVEQREEAAGRQVVWGEGHAASQVVGLRLGGFLVQRQQRDLECVCVCMCVQVSERV
jgi:hypothetical protein